jgi:hypothetical protein
MIVRIDLFAPFAQWRKEYQSAASTIHQEGLHIA